MDGFRVGLLIFFLLQFDLFLALYVADNTDSLHQVLSEFGVVRPIQTDSNGRFVSASVSAHRLHRNRRHAHTVGATPTVDDVQKQKWIQKDPPTNWRTGIQGDKDAYMKGGSWRGRSYWEEQVVQQEEGLFYNLTIFGRELHLSLRPNSRLMAPGATMEWWEESGHRRSQPIRGTSCFYTGKITNMEDTSVAISNCDGLAGMIRMDGEEFFIEPLNGGEEIEEDREGRQHVVYRSSAIIKPAVNQTAAVNQSVEDFVRGSLSGPLSMNQDVLGSGPGSGRRRRRFAGEAEQFNIEVLLAVDYSVLLFHGREHIQKYLLTLMNIVHDIYQDHSLGSSINIVLVRIILLSPTQSQELISVGNAQKSLENVCGWSYLQHRERLSHAEQHDHAIYLTRQEFGPSGMQGYAPVTGMCQLHRSCTLVQEDGFASAFVVAHETGHVLGMEHDGEANDCGDEVSLGSIMSPRVQAAFHQYHWSQCSRQELYQYLHTYDCLRDDPFHYDWPAQPQLPGFLYSTDQQCSLEFGPGYSTCTVYMTSEPCKQLLCSSYNYPFFCRTKKGLPLDGTPCGLGKHCFKGVCINLTPDLLRQDGGWSTWSPYGSCSRSCGGGVQFRTRRCDNPLPANRGRPCFGNIHEFQMCSQEACPPLTDFREEQCRVWNVFYQHEGRKHHWLPYQHPDPDERCQLYCQSKETRVIVSMNKTVHDGTPCSYSDPYSVCVGGECEHVGCDGQIASDQQDDRCGVCGGDNSSCKIIKGNFTRSAKKQGYLKILEIPKEARHLLIHEVKGTLHLLALKNQETDHVFLNDETDLPESRVVIERGMAWEYNNRNEQESIQTTGPLKYGVLLMVRPHGVSKVTVSYKYTIQDRLRSSLQSNLVQEDTAFYEWALKRWSHCSKPCGGGKQYTRFGCRRKADGKMVHRTFCTNINKPRAISRNCNSDTCSSLRWVTGDWEECSASCGQTGWQRRLVSCQKASSRGQHMHSVPSKFCSDGRPEGKRTCNRHPCPDSWRSGPWTRCSVTCGNGTQERQAVCLNPEGSAGNCSDQKPNTLRTCHAPSCNGDQKNFIIQWLSRSTTDFQTPNPNSRQRCRGDRSVFCGMEALSRYCTIAGYRQMCCKSCSDSSSSLWNSSTQDVTSASDSDITRTPPPTFTATPAPTSRGSTTDFTYVEYEDYEQFSSYEDSPPPTTTSPVPSAPEFHSTALWVEPDDVIRGGPSVTNRTSGGRSHKVRVTGSKPSTSLPFSSSMTLTRADEKKENEVPYRVFGLDTDRSQQSVFVPRMPPFHERTQNKRIQELLNEKRRQDVLSRPGRAKDPES
ncbi:A disintegrin and metalloproteinase with thrombospondin motifs 2-like [Thalassophryne amazonica]|uniref:A disintegrin and metalloproteinase with thrombospondin motifs 2-like n=1 Tax=Thalassophryne amazonica TaxID=390379 RepID=UPI0014715F13|nr:A disintegrin and metalloproteinase with thrombospondin motifs 2-like [Thalassophryne amazonica]